MQVSNTLMISLLITLSLPLIFSSIEHSKNSNLNKLINFECGFNQMSSNRISFSNQFFMIAILFLIFDLEITLILPIPTEENLNNKNILMSSILVMILFMGLAMEWKQGMLEWSK